MVTQLSSISADDLDICDGGTATLHSEVIGGAGGNNYQWQQLISGSWVNISGATAADYTTGALSVGSYTYRVVVIQDAGCEGVSDGVTIMVTSDPIATISVSDAEICDGGTTTFTSVVNGGSGTIQYAWQILVEGFWGDLFGANQSSYITEELAEGTYTYRVIVIRDSGCEDVSNEVSVVVNPDPVVEDFIDEASVCEGALPSYKVQ
jgi:hypothetical protein